MAGGMAGYETEVAARKAALFKSLRGDVLELGIGGGPNLRYYNRATVSSVTGVDVNDAFFVYAERANQARLPLRLLAASAQAIPLPDASVDAVVATLLLCSVADPSLVLREISRVLKPGGTYTFLEHVAADEKQQPVLAASQALFDPLQQALAGGCHLRRHTGAMLRASVPELFATVDVDEFQVPKCWPISSQIAGTAIVSSSRTNS